MDEVQFVPSMVFVVGRGRTKSDMLAIMLWFDSFDPVGTVVVTEVVFTDVVVTLEGMVVVIEFESFAFGCGMVVVVEFDAIELVVFSGNIVVVIVLLARTDVVLLLALAGGIGGTICRTARPPRMLDETIPCV